MNNRFRKILLTGLIGSLLMMPGCSPLLSSNASPTQALSPAAATPVDEQRAVTLWLSDWHLTEAHWEKVITEQMRVFEADNPSIHVELVPVTYAEKETRYITEIQAGAGPDLIHLHGFSIRSFIDKGFVYDLTPFIEQEPKTAWGGDFTDAWFPQTVELMKSEDRYYAIPSDFMAMVLFYNKQLFQEAGLDPNHPPETWDEFLEYAQILTRDRNGDDSIDTWGFGTVGAVDPGFELRFTPILLSFGADYLTPDQKCSALNSPEAKDAFNFYIDLVTEYQVIPPGVTSKTPTDLRHQMAAEEIAMKIGSGWTVPIVEGYNPDLNAGQVLAAAPIPTRAGRIVEKPTTAWISAWMINKNTQHPQEAWQLLKFMTSQEADQSWFTGARVLSARRDVSGGLEDLGVQPFPPLLDDPFANVIAAELHRSRFVPQIKEWPQIIEIINRAVQSGFSGAKTADQALNDAHEEINTILSAYRLPGETCSGY